MQLQNKHKNYCPFLLAYTCTCNYKLNVYRKFYITSTRVDFYVVMFVKYMYIYVPKDSINSSLRCIYLYCRNKCLYCCNIRIHDICISCSTIQSLITVPLTPTKIVIPVHSVNIGLLSS